MDVQQEKERLLQAKSIKWLQREIHPLDKVTVYMTEPFNQKTNRGICPALIPSSQIKKVLSDAAWDSSYDDGHPDVVRYSENKTKRVEYLRFGRTDGIEPFVIARSFDGIRDEYVEIVEEFRLFHNLSHDQKKNQYIKIDEEGDEHVIAVVEPRQVKIRLQEIREFLAVKEMHLSIQFVHWESSTYTPEELGFKGKREQKRGDLYCWDLFCEEESPIGKTETGTLSLLRGKRLIEPFPEPFPKRTKKYEDFIIDVDDDGNEVTYTCNPEKLRNLFDIDAAPGAPSYLTPISFRKEVLNRYYDDPEKYEVEESIIRCGYLWGVPIDSHHDDKVVVWLVDLGRRLPHKEQLHWKSHNIPSTTGASETYLRRTIFAQPTDSVRPEHIFQRRYKELREACQNYLGWQLFLPLERNDKYRFQGIRVPSFNSQKEFDELVIDLTMVLIESLNTKKLRELISKAEQQSIKLLAATLKVCKVTNADKHIDFLQKLQHLRSRGSAHRKDEDYKQALAHFKDEGDDLMATFENILRKSVAFLDFLIQAVNHGYFRETQ